MVSMVSALLGSETTAGMPTPSESTAWFAWALAVVCGVLASVCGLMWKTVRADLLAEREESKAARAENRQLSDAIMKEMVPAMTRMTDATNRATEALLAQGHR